MEIHVQGFTVVQDETGVVTLGQERMCEGEAIIYLGKYDVIALIDILQTMLKEC